MISAVIIDDKTANIQLLKDLLLRFCPQIHVTGEAINIDMGFDSIMSLKPALVFLDIEMPGGDGFELLRKFSNLFFEVIFVTAYNHYAIRAFRENAIDYLLKPIDVSALQQSVMKAEKQIGLKETNQNFVDYLKESNRTVNPKISIPVLDGYLFVNSIDIIRCEASGSYSWLYMSDSNRVMVSMRLKECEDLLSSQSFFRIHKSHIVNVNYVARYVRGRGGYILLQDGTMVEVSPSKKDAFLEAMKKTPLL